MSKAFITGVGGQDGGYLAEALLADGVEVHALTLRDDPIGDVPTDVVRHVGDITDVAATRALIADLAPDAVYNLAAISSVAQSWEAPDLSSLVNGSAAVGLLESAYLVGARFVQASSAEMFGEPARSPQDESTPIQPHSPYGVAKAYAHLMVAVYRRRGMHASSLVLYNHESPRRPVRFVTRKITSTVAAISRGDASGLTLGNLDTRRDWGWAPDYVAALVAAASAAEPDDYVIATGVSHSIRDLVDAAFTHVGIDDWDDLVTVDGDLARPADATELVGDSSRARAALGWKPTVGFEEIVSRMVAADLDD